MSVVKWCPVQCFFIISLLVFRVKLYMSMCVHKLVYISAVLLDSNWCFSSHIYWVSCFLELHKMMSVMKLCPVQWVFFKIVSKYFVCVLQNFYPVMPWGYLSSDKNFKKLFVICSIQLILMFTSVWQTKFNWYKPNLKDSVDK